MASLFRFGEPYYNSVEEVDVTRNGRPYYYGPDFTLTYNSNTGGESPSKFDFHEQQGLPIIYLYVSPCLGFQVQSGTIIERSVTVRSTDGHTYTITRNRNGSK